MHAITDVRREGKHDAITAEVGGVFLGHVREEFAEEDVSLQDVALTTQVYMWLRCSNRHTQT